MTKLEALLEAERRGILPPDKQNALNLARQRGLVPDVSRETPVAGQISAPEPQLDAPAQYATMGDVGSAYARNLPSDALRVGKETLQAIASPIDTAKTVGKSLIGAAQRLSPPELRGKQDYSEYGEALVGGLKEDYGGLENIKRTIAEKPAQATLDALTLGAVGPAVVGRVAGVAPKLRKPGKAETVENAPATEDLRERGDELFAEVKAADIDLTPERYREFGQDLAATLADEGIDRVLHPKISRNIELILESPTGTLDMKRLMLTRRRLKEAAKGVDPDKADERRLAGLAVDKFDNFINEVTPAGGKFAEANETWRRFRNSELIEETIEKAMTRAAGKEAGLRNEFSKLSRNKKLMKTFNKAERAAIKKVADGSAGLNVLRRIGGLSPGEGQRRNLLTSMGGMYGGAEAFGAPGAVAAPLIGMTAQRMAQAGTLQNANLARAMAAYGGSPSVPPPLRLPRPSALATTLAAYQGGRAGQ